MAKRGKTYRKDLEKVEVGKFYSLPDALTLISSFAERKFDEAVEVAIKLGVDPKQSDQMVRGATVLPNGVGKSVRVVAIVRGDAEKEAQEAGADHVGNDELIEKISKGWLDFDRVITTPECVKDLTKVARVLGPKGMMPNKKTGTVTNDIGKAVKEQKLGKVNYKVEKAGIVHAMVGKRSFGADKLKENFVAFYDSILKAKPNTSKGVYIRKVSLTSTMGPGIPIDVSSLEGLNKAV